jgi:hypothetical protein
MEIKMVPTSYSKMTSYKYDALQRLGFSFEKLRVISVESMLATAHRGLKDIEQMLLRRRRKPGIITSVVRRLEIDGAWDITVGFKDSNINELVS